jgi:hypothetical protein
MSRRRIGGLAGWRQQQDEQLFQQAFLADINRHWRPATAQERRLERRAAVVHSWVRLFDGPPSLAPAAGAGVLAALGVALLPAAAQPDNPDYTLGPPTWAYLLLTLGLIGLAIETARSPRRIRPVPYALTAALPISLGAGFIGLMLHVATPADQALRIGVPSLGIGVVAVAISSALQRYAVQRLALRLTAVACALTAIGQLDWAYMYADSGYHLLAVACACSAGGALLNAMSFARARLRGPASGQPPMATPA